MTIIASVLMQICKELPGLSDQWPWASIRKMKFSEEQCWRQIQALGFYLAVWASIWQ